MEYVCVFAASSARLDQSYTRLARELGEALAKSGRGLVFGGGDSGLMGACARGVKENGGQVVGVIPEKLNVPGIPYLCCDRMLQTKTMHERKAAMESLSMAFVALPGGFGTLEELLEVIVLKQLGYHDRPIVILNYRGFYAALIEQLERCIEENFTGSVWRGLYYAAPSVSEAMRYIGAYTAQTMPDKMEEARANG